MQITDKLETKREEVARKIDALRREIASLELQCSAFNVVIRVYDADYRPESMIHLRYASVRGTVSAKGFGRGGLQGT